MEVLGHQITFQWPSRRRLPWLLLALGLMFVSAFSVFPWMWAVARISGWIGLPQYEAQIPQLQTQAEVWLGLAIALPFVAALLLGFGKTSSADSSGSGSTTTLTYPAESQAENWTAPIVHYFRRLIISLLGTLGFFLCLLLIDFVFYKLRIHGG